MKSVLSLALVFLSGMVAGTAINATYTHFFAHEKILNEIETRIDARMSEKTSVAAEDPVSIAHYTKLYKQEYKNFLKKSSDLVRSVESLSIAYRDHQEVMDQMLAETRLITTTMNELEHRLSALEDR